MLPHSDFKNVERGIEIAVTRLTTARTVIDSLTESHLLPVLTLVAICRVRETGLLPSPALRTVRVSFPAHGSSLDNAPCGTRFRYGKTFGMNLPVTVRMNKDAVFYSIRTSQCLVDNVVVVPACHFRDGLVTDGAESVLFFPKIAEQPATTKIVLHLEAQVFFKVHLPFGIVGIALAFYLSMPLNGRISGEEKVVPYGFPFLFRYAEERPIISVKGRPIFLFYPMSVFIGVSSACPLP